MPTPTFAQILRRSAAATAASAWRRARTASGLRHLAREQGRPRAARLLSRVKGEALALVARLAPADVDLRRDLAHPRAHLSLRLRRRGRLHVPPSHEWAVLSAHARAALGAGRTCNPHGELCIKAG